MQFALHVGLMLRHGQRTLELTRELDGQEYVFTDVLTGRVSVVKLAALIKKIYAKQYEVVRGDAPFAMKDVAQWPAVVDLSSLTERERALLEYRLRYVKALQRLRITRGQRDLINKAIPKIAAAADHVDMPTSSAVMHWARKYQLSGMNPLSLVDKHRIRKHPKRMSDATERILWRVLKRCYFTQDLHSIRHAHEQLTKSLKQAVQQRELEPAEAQVSYVTMSRRVHGVDLYQRIASREGHARARMVCRTAFPDGVAMYPLQRVEIDHTPLNWVVICDRTGLPLGRPTLTVMIDAYSGYILGFYLSFYGPGLTSVAGVVRNAILPKEEITAGLELVHPWLAHGLGDEWVIDNGLEFHSFGFKTMAMCLGVDLMYCRVRTPWLKPHVERFFSTLNTLSLVRGRVSKTVANVMRIDPYKDAAITFSDLVRGLLMFVVDVHPHEPNWRKMSTSFDLYRDGIDRSPPAIFPGSLEQLKLAAGMSKTLTLSQGGIELQGLPFGSYAFKDIVNKHGSGLKLLCKWDPDDMSLLHVRDPDGLQWHTAECRWTSYAQGLSYNQHRLIRQFGRAELKSADRVEALMRARQRLHDHWMDATTRRGRANALLAGRYADLTSHKVLSPSSAPGPEHPVTLANRLISTEEMVFQEKDIPSFETFTF
ncbi:transposase family protein [Hydrogenophaga sp. D2P1]|uniref:Transposase family protein n=1 Tax=Hydrogenophaga aromaticivorans TaxID=2610898 RepID=A0A7Y8KXT0_9BURK|nr:MULTISPECIES: DDE-type integrase/transposase/recombinase [Hydrogenophaga]NWF46334.1 transposase family protein [Hydrogenophaga aromaticivorans]UCU93400.1 transposase family protein [Hydrogenophaga taeniospiralis]